MAMGRGARTGSLRVEQGRAALRGGRRLHRGLWVGLRGGHGGLVEVRKVGGAAGGLGVCCGGLKAAQLICR